MKTRISINLLFVFIFIFIITGCGSKERTIEYLLDKYVKAYTTADIEAIHEIYPSYYIEYAKDFLTKEKLESNIKDIKQEYGDDFTITYEIDNSSKVNSNELKKINDKITSNYKTIESATECYKYEVRLKIVGSKKTQPNSLTTIGYCKYNDKWYLVSIN